MNEKQRNSLLIGAGILVLAIIVFLSYRIPKTTHKEPRPTPHRRAS
jgi:hypothetical protein